MKKIITLVLALSVMLSLFAGCSETNSSESAVSEAVENTQVTQEITEPEKEIERDEYGREIPAYPLDDELDFGGYDIRMLSRDLQRWYIDFGVDELNGELVNDAVYNRNLAVESDLNVVLSRVMVDCENMTVSDRILTNVKAGDTAYDIAGLYQLYGTAPSLAGAFMNFYNVPYVNFTNPWWNHSFTEELTYDGRLYFSVGDMNVSVTSTLMGIFFNQNKFIDYYGDYSVLYDTVREGKWTKDEFARFLNGTYIDLNANGKKDKNDFMGFALDEADIGPWLQAFDLRICTKDESGTPQLTYYSEKSVAAHEWMYSFFLENPDVYFAPKNSGYMDLFKNDQSLFSVIKFDDAATTLRDMEPTYGVLPMPKFDENQSEYYNGAHDNSNLTGVIINTQNPGAVGAAMELLSYYSYLDVTPAYFEVALKAKYFQDVDSAEMFDIIRNGVIVDFGVVYALEIGGGSYSDKVPSVMSRNLIRHGNIDITSEFKSCEKIWQKKLDSILKTYQELDA